MPENGGIPSTGDPHVDAALERIRGKYPQFEEALIALIQAERTLGKHGDEDAGASLV